LATVRVQPSTSAASFCGTLQEYLLPLADRYGWPTGMNNKGDVIGFDIGEAVLAWVWSSRQGKMMINPSPPIFEGVDGAVPNAINDRGDVCIYQFEPALGFASRSYVRSPSGVYTALGDPNGAVPSAGVICTGINNKGDVAGYYSSSGALRPFRWRYSTGFEVLPLESFTNGGTARDITENGWIAGDVRPPSAFPGSVFYAALWTPDNRLIPLPPLTQTVGAAISMNEKGVAVGFVGGVAVGFVGAVAAMWTPNK
jgi:hypothetical protein